MNRVWILLGISLVGLAFAVPVPHRVKPMAPTTPLCGITIYGQCPNGYWLQQLPNSNSCHNFLTDLCCPAYSGLATCVNANEQVAYINICQSPDVSSIADSECLDECQPTAACD